MAKALKILYVPDLQAKPVVSLRHVTTISRFIADKQPDVVVQGGDLWDLPSLSSYDAGKRVSEGVRLGSDWKAGQTAVSLLMEKVRHEPRWVFTEGNHEDRLRRYGNDNPAIDVLPDPCGYLSGLGWETYPYLRPVSIAGVNFCHIFPRATTGRVTGFSARNGPASAIAMIKANMQSCVMGHRQGLDFAVYNAGSRTYYGLIAGSAYRHQESYLTPQYTNYWRGVILLHRVKNGTFDPCFVSLDYLKERYQP